MSGATTAEFRFRFEPRYRPAARVFGITDRRAVVRVGDGLLAARFGPWVVRTPLANIRSVSITGPYHFIKTAGPAHLSLADRGLTFATNGERGVCLDFLTPITGLDPFGLIHHPNLTVTVDRIEELVGVLAARAGPAGPA